MSLFGIITTGMAIIGAIAVSRNKSLLANYIWSISNPLLIIYNYINGMIDQTIMFCVFTLVAWYGVYNLKIKENE